jgi:WD40 repeat protein
LIALAQLPSSVRNLMFQPSTGMFFSAGPHLIQWSIDLDSNDDKLSSEIIYAASEGESIRCLTNSPIHPSLIFGGADNGQIYIWEVTVDSSRLATCFNASTRTPIHTIQAFENSTLIVGDNNGSLNTWSYQGGRIRTSKFIKSRSTQVGPSASSITGMYFESSSNVGVVGCKDSTIWFVDHEAPAYNLIGQQSAATRINTSRLVSVHSSYINDVVFDNNGTFAATAGSDGSLRLWNIRDTLQTLQFQVKKESCLSVSFNPSNTRLAAAFSDGCVRIISMETLQLESKIELAVRKKEKRNDKNH